MTTISGTEHFRRTKKPVHPKKAAAREALHQLKDAGIDILDQCYIHRNIFFLVQNDRSIIDDIIKSAQVSNWKEKALLRNYVTNLYVYPSIRTIKKRHLETMENIRVVAPIIRSESAARDQYWGAVKVIDGIKESLPEGTDIDMAALFPAALLFEDLYSSAVTKGGGYYSHWNFKIDKNNIDDVIAIAQNLDQVEKFKPTLLNLRIYRGQQISNIIEAGSVPLSSGVL